MQLQGLRPLQKYKRLLAEQTLPVQIMHLGFTEMHDLNGPIFGLYLKIVQYP
jgi:hypothetical protein